MRIGEFSKEFGVTIDTVRHYMDMGIILPLKEGAQYFFNKRCEQDMSVAIELKSYDFTVKEIQSYLYYDRLAQMGPSIKNSLFDSMLKQKKKELSETISRLNCSVEAIDQRLSNQTQEAVHNNMVLGIPLDTLSMFVCPHCEASLTLNGNLIHENMILEGSLNCVCGWKADIENGILLDKDHVDVSYGITLEEWSEFIADYVRLTPPEFFKILYTGVEWTKKNIAFDNIETILDIRSGTGYFLRSVLNDLADNVTYISLDKDYRMSQFVKSALEAVGIKKRIIFISTSHKSIPLKKKSIDCLIDSRGTLNYMIDPDEKDTTFYLSYFIDLLSDNATLLANYLVFDHFCLGHSHIPKAQRDYFKASFYEGELKKLGIDICNIKESSDLPNGSIYENYYHDNDRLHFVSYIGKK